GPRVVAARTWRLTWTTSSAETTTPSRTSSPCAQGTTRRRPHARATSPTWRSVVSSRSGSSATSATEKNILAPSEGRRTSNPGKGDPHGTNPRACPPGHSAPAQRRLEAPLHRRAQEGPLARGARQVAPHREDALRQRPVLGPGRLLP